MKNSDENESKAESYLDLHILEEQVEKPKDVKETKNETITYEHLDKKSEVTKNHDFKKKSNLRNSRRRSKSSSTSRNRSRSAFSRSSRSHSNSMSSRSSRSSSQSSRSSYNRNKAKNSKKKCSKRRKYSSSRSRSSSYSMSSKSSRSCSRSYTRSRSKSSSRSLSSRTRSSSNSRSYSRSLSTTSSQSSNRRYKNRRNSSYSTSRSRSRSRQKIPKLTSSARIRNKNTFYTCNPTSAFYQNHKNKNRFGRYFPNVVSNRNKNLEFNLNRNEEATLKVKSVILSHLNLNNKAKEDCAKRKLKAKMEKEASEKLIENKEKIDDDLVIPITSFQNKSDTEEDEEIQEIKKHSPVKKIKIENKSDDEEEQEKTKNMLNVLGKLKRKSLNTANETKMTIKSPIIKAGQLSKNKNDEATGNKLIGPKLPYYKKLVSEKVEEQTDKIKAVLQPINYSKDDMAKYEDLLKRSQLYAKYNQVSVFNLGPNGETHIKMVELEKNDTKIENENPIQLQSNELYGLSVPGDVILKPVENKIENENQSLIDVNSEEKLQTDFFQQHQAQNLFLQQSHAQLSQPLQFIPIQNPIQQIIQLPNSGLNLNMLHSNSLNLMQASCLNFLQQPIMAIQNPGLPIQYLTNGQISQQFIQLRPSLSTLTPQPQFIINSPYYRIIPQ